MQPCLHFKPSATSLLFVPAGFTLVAIVGSQLCGPAHHRMKGFYTIEGQHGCEAWPQAEAAANVNDAVVTP